MSELLLTVVIPSYNSEAFIEYCLKSVEREAHLGVEFILIDGNSSDATMEIVNRYRHLFSHVLSEPDRGQSDAFNKGFNLAKGKFLTWLNSDDVLCVGAISHLLPVLRSTRRRWITANTLYLDENGKVTRCCRSGGFEHFAVKRGLLNVFGPSTIFSKELYDQVGPLDESFHYCMDTEYWWRIFSVTEVYHRVPVYFWGLRLHDAAKTANVLLKDETPPRMREERRLIKEKYYPNVSDQSKARVVKLARVWRLLNTSYLRSYMDTLRMKGKGYQDV